jgi:hypothetical protein
MYFITVELVFKNDVHFFAVLVRRCGKGAPPFNPELTYYMRIDYERCGVPCTGKRLFVCQGWDPAVIGERIGTKHLFDLNVAMDDPFIAVPGDENRKKRGWEEPTTTIQAAYEIARTCKVPGAATLLNELKQETVTHQHNYAMGPNHWFFHDDEYYGLLHPSRHPVKHYSGVRIDGVPYVWKTSKALKEYGWAYLKQRRVPHVPKPIGRQFARLKDPVTKAGYRPVKRGVQLWVKALPSVRTVDGQLALTTGNVLWKKDNALPVEVNFKVVRQVNAQDQRILMTFPGDYKLYCGDACVDKMKVNQNAIVDCCKGQTFRAPPAFKSTRDQECFGDAIPPLVSLRIGLEIIERRRERARKRRVSDQMMGALLGRPVKKKKTNVEPTDVTGGADEMAMPSSSSVYQTIVESSDQTKTMLEMLYRFNRTQREAVSHPAFSNFLGPFEDYLRNTKKLKSAGPLARSLKPIVLAHPLFSEEGTKALDTMRKEAKQRRTRTRFSSKGGSNFNSAVNKVPDFLRAVPVLPKRIKDVLFGDLPPLTDLGKESLRIIDERADACAKLGFVDTMSKEEATRRYRALALKMHPDKEGGTHEGFQQLGNCYEKMMSE